MATTEERGARDRGWVPWVALTLSLVLWLAGGAALANGGTVRVSSQRTGPFEVSVFTDPTPVRVGVCDVSVAVGRAGGGDLVQDATVTVRAEPLGRPGMSVAYPATHELATNKLFYAAHVQLPAAGRWRLEVEMRSALGEGAVSFEVDAEEPGPFDNPVVVIGAALVPLAGALWLLSRAGRKRRS